MNAWQWLGVSAVGAVSAAFIVVVVFFICVIRSR